MQLGCTVHPIAETGTLETESGAKVGTEGYHLLRRTLLEKTACLGENKVWNFSCYLAGLQ